MKYKDIPQFFRDFLSYTHTIQGKSRTTVDEYYYDIRMFLRFIKCYKTDEDYTGIALIDIADFSVAMLNDITLSDIYEYLSYMARQRGNSSTSRARKVSSLRSFMNYLSSKSNILQDNPAKDLDMPKIAKTLPHYLSLSESIQLLDAVEGKYATRDYAMLTLFLNCGLRVSELTGINISDIKEDRVVVTGKNNKQRTIYLNEACKTAVYEYLAQRPRDGVKDRDALFLSQQKTRISRKMIHVLVKKYLGAAGLDTDNISTHKLRHTAATLMYRHGNVDVRALQEILGHEQLTTTQIYTHVDNETIKNAIDSNPLANINARKNNVDIE